LSCLCYRTLPDKIELIKTGKKLGKDFLKVDIRGVCLICKGKLYKLSSNIKANQIKQYYKEKSEAPSTILEQEVLIPA
jgi:hypothetical protein